MAVFVASGNFWVSPALTNHTRDVGAETLLSPNPTEVEYGDRLNHSNHESQGRLITQWTNTNPTARKWVWKGYGPHVPKYQAQYELLYNMQERINVIVNSGSPYVYMKEDTTDGLSIYSVSSGKLVPDWVRCRINMVQRKPRSGGGTTVYETSEVVFTVDDPNFITY